MRPPPLTLRKTLGWGDGLALVVGIMVGSGIFRTPGLVASAVGRPALSFVAWALGGAVGLLGALVFAELATRHPHAGGKYVYARESFGRRAAFVIGWIEALGTYCAAIAAVAVVSGDYLGRLMGWNPRAASATGVVLIVALTALHLVGVRVGSLAQNVVTAAKMLALVAVVVVAALVGRGAGWTGRLPGAPTGPALFGAMAVAFQAVIWSYYGYPDAGKIAEELKDPDRSLPRVFLGGIAAVTALYLLLNAAFVHVLPFDRIAASTLVAGDAAGAMFGPRAGAVMSALALLVVLASLNGNLFVTPRVVFGLSRDGLGPQVLSRVNAGGTPWTALLLVALVAVVLAATGTFERLLSLAITFILVTDGFMVVVLFRLRSGRPAAPFRVPLYPLVPLLFLGTYVLLLLGALIQQPGITLAALAALAGVGLVSWRVVQPTA
ncbi:MAG TPA: amino acid permease [Myxococcaceae bacterium]|nr:amino acid permease [Myxococcaceae bacterium]